MVANIEQNEVQKPKVYKFSLGVFLVVFLMTVGIYFYNMNLDSKINSVGEEVSQMDTNIKKAKEDGYYIVYKQTLDNKIVLDKYSYLSNVPDFVNNLKSLSTQNNVFFSGFNYSNGKITSKATTINDTVSTAGVKAKSFIELFRNNSTNIFSLGFVNSFEGQDRINFNVDFNVK